MVCPTDSGTLSCVANQKAHLWAVVPLLRNKTDWPLKWFIEDLSKKCNRTPIPPNKPSGNRQKRVWKPKRISDNRQKRIWKPKKLSDNWQKRIWKPKRISDACQKRIWKPKKLSDTWQKHIWKPKRISGTWQKHTWWVDVNKFTGHLSNDLLVMGKFTGTPLFMGNFSKHSFFTDSCQYLPASFDLNHPLPKSEKFLPQHKM